jgi:hypothetical protein
MCSIVDGSHEFSGYLTLTDEARMR